MRKILFIILSAPFFLFCQQVTETTIMHNGLERSYILYVPASYSTNIETPLVLNLHGYSSNAGQQMIYSNFYPIADEEGFILVHPEGTTDLNGFQFWNSGELSEVDDVGFLSTLIDQIALEFNINLNRVYSMGMSNGGFMSYRLACELSDKIAAIASVTGSMSTNQITSCNPDRPVPVMQIHGTADPTVLYDGNNLLSIESIDNVISFWVNFNNCNTVPNFNNIPDINLLDLCTAEHYIYQNGTNDSSVEFYKIINGGHTWPGALIPLTANNTNQDFNASEKIWDFFNQYDINGLINNTSINESTIENKKTIYTIDLLGRKNTNSNIYIELYSDGTSAKRFIINPNAKK